MNKIKIAVGSVSLTAELFDNPTAEAVWQALPFDLPYNVWGDEIYFSIPVFAGLEEGQEIMEIGDLAYWPPGHAFCIFYGRTPASTDERPRAASEVSRFGRLDGNTDLLRKAKGKTIRIERIEE